MSALSIGLVLDLIPYKKVIAFHAPSPSGFALPHNSYMQTLYSTTKAFPSELVTGQHHCRRQPREILHSCRFARIGGGNTVYKGSSLHLLSMEKQERQQHDLAADG